jgi:hypothetical protein
MKTVSRPLPSKQRLPLPRSCFRLACRPANRQLSVEILSPKGGNQKNSRSTWQISTPSLLFAQLAIASPPSSFFERLVRRPRGICCSCSGRFVSPALCDGTSTQLQRRLGPEDNWNLRKTCYFPRKCHRVWLLVVKGGRAFVVFCWCSFEKLGLTLGS